MQIGELSKVSGMTTHTIRFYESKGLLPKVMRGMNGYRHYNDESIQRLASIQCAKRLGFSLEDMLVVLADRDATEGLDHDKIIQQLDTRLEEVDSLMQALKTQRAEIKQFKHDLQQTWQQGKCMQVDEINASR